MIKSIDFIQYKKLKNITINFSPKLNAISGTNGTCKSSILYLISNSFQKVNKKCNWIKDSKCLDIINGINISLNPKIESLARETMQAYKDPAVGVKGTLYTSNYFNNSSLDFRRHNSEKHMRYALKPVYKAGAHQSLPFCPVIYLGLPRLVPYGEYENDKFISNSNYLLPKQYQDELADKFKDFTNYDIDLKETQKLGKLKYRTEFTSKEEGVDSNTISAGQDNLFIILTALESLHYYYDSIDHPENDSESVKSVLLIDELDATLHPAFQIKLLDTLRSYSEKYKIQVVFTTHSLTTIEDSLRHKDNVIYLLDLKDSVSIMPNPDIYEIKMQLQSLTAENIYQDKVIPIFTEDAEARLLLRLMFKYFEANYSAFVGVRRYLHLVEANVGADSLRGIFKDNELMKSTMRSICILDGDQHDDKSNCIITLPGRNLNKKLDHGLSPEDLLFEYADYLYKQRNDFWTDDTILHKGISKDVYLYRIKNPLDKFRKQPNKKKKQREVNKKIFNNEKSFFILAFKHWLNNPGNSTEIKRFYFDLKAMFKKVATYNEIDPNEWKDEK